MAHFGERAVTGSHVLVGAKSQYFRGSLQRAGGFRGSRVGAS